MLAIVVVGLVSVWLTAGGARGLYRLACIGLAAALGAFLLERALSGLPDRLRGPGPPAAVFGALLPARPVFWLLTPPFAAGPAALGVWCAHLGAGLGLAFVCLRLPALGEIADLERLATWDSLTGARKLSGGLRCADPCPGAWAAVWEIGRAHV